MIKAVCLASLACVGVPLFVACDAAPSAPSSGAASSAPVEVASFATRARASSRSNARDPAPARSRAAHAARSARPDASDTTAPQLRSSGGPTLDDPRFVPIFYPGDPLRSSITDFLTKLGPSAYWKTVAAEYGIAPASMAPPVTQAGPAPATIDDLDIQAWLLRALAAPGATLPAPDGNSVYVFYYPEATTITSYGATSCLDGGQGFGAYHSAVTLPSGESVAYAVVPRCAHYRFFPGGLDFVTEASSHELLEAVTDPYFSGYDDPSWEGNAWTFIGGYPASELGDFCEFQPDIVVRDPALGYSVQRIWSNREAAAFRDPCVPAPDRPYFNAQPLVGGTLASDLTYIHGVSIPPGGRATIPVRLFSDRPTGSWKLSASVDPDYAFDPSALTFSFDRDEGRAGDIRRLTITRAPAPAGAGAGAPITAVHFVITSTQGSVTNRWWGVVGQDVSSGGEEMPQLVSSGGPVVASPRIVPVFHAGDPMAAQLGDFLAKLASSEYLARGLGEYGVGHTTIAPAITIAEPAPPQMTTAEVTTWLTAKLADPSFPKPDANTLYALFYPSGTEIAFGSFSDPAAYPVCSIAGAYHDDIETPTGAAAFVVVPRCDAGGVLGLRGLDEVTLATSAELAGAATNPDVEARPAYASPNFAGSSWFNALGTHEVGELCEVQPDGHERPASIGYTVSRLWSNRSAAASREGCLPAATRSHRYFSTTIPIDDGTELYPSQYAHGFSLAPGAQATIPIHLYASGDAPCTWALSATESYGPTAQPTGELSFTFDRPTGAAGDTRHLTVKRAPLADGETSAPLPFAILSTSGAESHATYVIAGP